MTYPTSGGRTSQGPAVRDFGLYSKAMQKRDSRRTANSTVRIAVAAGLAAAVFGRPLAAQDMTGRCTTPDSIAVRGNNRIADQKIRTEAGLTVGSVLNFPVIQRAIRALYSLNQFDYLEVQC